MLRRACWHHGWLLLRLRLFIQTRLAEYLVAHGGVPAVDARLGRRFLLSLRRSAGRRYRRLFRLFGGVLDDLTLVLDGPGLVEYALPPSQNRPPVDYVIGGSLPS